MEIRCPRLPIEITHEIIDVLSSLTDGRESLLSCALVSHEFHARVLHHLFASVAIRQKAATEADGAKASKRLHDLAQIIDRNPQIATRIFSFHLKICSKQVDNFSDRSHHRWITEDTNLPFILPKLIRIREFRLNNADNFFDFGALNSSVISTLRAFFGSSSLESILFAAISNVPLDLLAHCANLKKLRLQLIPNFLGYPSNRTLRVALLGSEDVAVLWRVLQQTLQTLQHLIIVLWDFNTSLPNNSVNLSHLRALLSLTLSYKTYLSRSTWSPARLCEFFEFEGIITLESLEIKIVWVGVKYNQEQRMAFQTADSWAAFDEVITSGKFVALKELKLDLRLVYSPTSEPQHLDEEQENKRLLSYMEPLLPKISASRIRFQLKINLIRREATSSGNA
ncbi:hypothetical protein GALMADRAFT_208488 [Galerina marginata CBS 339.88]|uniref:F-box domain-containing protein n=1 Tax=Galerina marginata (strain CBS 339.88) TaxID=685588 RepID=A0A067TN56_GALM3|nr:hypothetical protein GALMADRAFT_208488 [Galerina marginata CBS 339.88]